ncbi:MAG: 2-C-methyl-D-erythritol 4-phosphate cytidylyltransferase [Bacteroidaceae bacterium]|nr:2-C-methyl-D-erythritol 4-phosphate cytidylyltransferase [Bacteroidaceae bacterium]
MFSDPTKNIVLLLAGGEGTRARQSVPKQYVQIEGIPILAYTLRAFDRHKLIDAIYVVCQDRWRDYVHRFVSELSFSKFAGTFTAGSTSFESIRNGIRGIAEIHASTQPENAGGLSSEGPVILVHDGVRPLISADVITDSIRVCRLHGNAITAVQTEEAYMAGDAEKATSMIPREQLWGAQTPHTFRLGDLTDAFAEADRRGIATSQSLYTLMAELGHWPLYKSRGERVNLKITNPEDIWFFSRLASVL